MIVRGSKRVRASLPIEIERTASAIVDAAFKVHTKLGPGLLESVYESCLTHELFKKELKVERQIELPVKYDTLILNSAYRVDMIVQGCVLVENKAVEAVLPVHRAQVLTYLRLSGYRLGLLINFNVPLIKDGIERIIN